MAALNAKVSALQVAEQERFIAKSNVLKGSTLISKKLDKVHTGIDLYLSI